MSIINFKDKTINAKIVYYGTALGGKTTSLKHVHRVIDPEQKVELVSLNTESDRTLFFDFLPITLGVIGGYTVRLQGFTVPGQVKYNLTRKYVLTGADAVVFVVDSQRAQLENNLAAFENLKENLLANGMDYGSIPLVLQYNKRDLEDRVPLEELDSLLNDRGMPSFESVATRGSGVFEAFVDISKRMMAHIGGQYRIDTDKTTVADALGRNLTRYLSRMERENRVASASGAPGPPEETRSVSTWTSNDADDSHGALVQVQGEDADTDSECLLKSAVDSNIEVARLYSQVNEVKNRLHDRVRELATLNELGKTLASELDVERLLGVVLRSATACLGTEHGSLLLTGTSEDGLLEQVVRGFRRDPLAATMFGGAGARMLLDMATRGDGLLLNGEGQAALLTCVRRYENSISSLMVAPMVSRDRVLGVIAVYFMDGECSATAEKQRFLSALARHAAVALENARLVTRIEGFNRELEQTVMARTAELRKAYEDLRELDRLKDDFLSSMSHELLTPLTSIQSFSEILLSMDEQELRSSLAEFLKIINNESLRLTQRLQSLLDLSRIEAGKITFRREDFDLRPVMERLLQERRAQFAARSVGIAMNVPPHPIYVHGDPVWLTRAVGNLLDNALEFSQENCEVILELGMDGKVPYVAVEDDGIGIPEKFQSIIFQRFKQLGDVLTGKPRGVGLGLPLAREIVERHGGRISVESRPGIGSRFTITLAVARNEALPVQLLG